MFTHLPTGSVLVSTIAFVMKSYIVHSFVCVRVRGRNGLAAFAVADFPYLSAWDHLARVLARAKSKGGGGGGLRGSHQYTTPLLTLMFDTDNT